ncbi:uncharacterized protein J3D65DRAFT_627563 [Phyllosticta citribraziliensis]|uniref:39S ribosomal protein L59, mitochondrial n=1 Tax=Phyllosticta citribraziliensis TaxID=989973 RepID=A0ABR1LLS1_9PEZI
MMKASACARRAAQLANAPRTLLHCATLVAQFYSPLLRNAPWKSPHLARLAARFQNLLLPNAPSMSPHHLRPAARSHSPLLPFQLLKAPWAPLHHVRPLLLLVNVQLPSTSKKPTIQRIKSFMLRNKRGMARFRNEAFPPLDGARLEGMPVLTQVPTEYRQPNGEIGVFQQWRWVQPTTILDQEKYDAAIKRREEEWQEKCRKKAYDDILELGRDKCEKLRGQMHTWFAQVAKDNGQQHM